MPMLKSLKACGYTCKDVELSVRRVIQEFVGDRMEAEDEFVDALMEKITEHGTDLLRSKLEEKFEECEELEEEVKRLNSSRELLEWQLEQKDDEIRKLEKDLDSAYAH